MVYKAVTRKVYPWNEWFDGNPHVAEYGLDFLQPPETFRKQILNAAARRGLTVETSVVGEKATLGVWMQAVGRIAR